MAIGEFIKGGDWKGEKHVPVIEINKADDKFNVEVSVGKEIPHPNTIEHHIKWIDLYVKYDDSPLVVHLAHFEFTPVTTYPKASVEIKLEKSGKFIATSYCNIHGLWESEKIFEL